MLGAGPFICEYCSGEYKVQQKRIMVHLATQCAAKERQDLLGRHEARWQRREAIHAPCVFQGLRALKSCNNCPFYIAAECTH